MKVKVEKLPNRCEICHKADLFNARKNYCLRCNEFQEEINIDKKNGFSLFGEKSKTSLSDNTASILLGVIAPLVCLFFDPVVFVNRGFLKSPFEQYRVFGYLEISLAIFALLIWVGCGKHLKKWGGLFAGIFAAGGLFALIIGIRLLPYTLLGLMIIIGIVGFVPFLTFLVYLEHALAAFQYIKLTKSTLDKTLFIVKAVLGLSMAMLIPALGQWQTSKTVSTAMQAVLQKEPKSVERDVKTLKNAFWCTDACYDDIVWAYKDEKDNTRRDFLAKIYTDITGNTVELRMDAFSD